MKDLSVERIAGLFYDGVLSAQDWYDGLDGTRAFLGAGLFDYFTLDNAGSPPFNGVHNQGYVGLHAEKLREYQSHFMGEDLRMAALAKMPAGQVMLDHEHISIRDMSCNIVYADFLRPHGFRHTLGTVVRDEGGSRDFLGFIRPADREPYGATDKAFLQQLMPELRRAAMLRARAGHLVRQAAMGLAALNALPQGITLVDAQCRIQYSNPRAERLFASNAALRVRQGRLACDEVKADIQLLQQVKRACSGGGLGRAGALSLIGARERLVVTVLPLKADHVTAAHWQIPLALVIVVDPAASATISPNLVSDVLGLSPTEARLALLLASGKTVKDFAAVQGCTWNTARTHLTQLLHKAGCRRQTELIALLQSLQLGG